MFEQELYNGDTAEKSQEGDLFHNYERKNWDFGPRIYKILAISALFNILALGFVGQTDLLTRRGCDSPFVSRVCQVLDMAYVGSVLLGTNRDYVDEEYARIDLGESEITYIDLTNPPFAYPPDYFRIANPVQYAQRQQEANNPTAGFTSPMAKPTTGNDLISRAPVLPKSNPNAVTGDIPESPFSVAGDDSNVAAIRKGRNGGRPIRNKPSTNSTDPNDQVANNASNSNTNTSTTPPTDQVAAVDINKRPMMDLGNFINELREKNEVNLESEFIVNAKGKLDKNGRLDPKTFKYIQATSDDKKIIEVVQESIEAINVAGYLQYLKELSGKDVALMLQQDATNISAAIQSEMESDSRAKAIKSSLDLAISIAKMSKTGANATQNDKDDLMLLENAKIEVDGKKVIIRFTVPKTLVHPMIQRKLAEQAAEMKKPNGNAVNKPNDNTAAR